VRQCPSDGVATPYSVQGLEQNIGHFSQLLGDRFWDSVPFFQGLKILQSRGFEVCGCWGHGQWSIDRANPNAFGLGIEWRTGPVS